MEPVLSRSITPALTDTATEVVSFDHQPTVVLKMKRSVVEASFVFDPCNTHRFLHPISIALESFQRGEQAGWPKDAVYCPLGGPRIVESSGRRISSA